MENISEWTIGIFTDILGPWFWAIMLFLVVGVVYLRTNSFGPAFLILLAGASVFNLILPGGEMQAILFFAVVFGIMYAFYRLFVKRTTPYGE